MATAAGAKVARISFWAKMSIGISAFILFGFAQFGLRGFVPYTKVPAIFHIHGLVMLSWLGLFVTQSLLAGRTGDTMRSGVGARLALHRKVGWASAVMLPLIAILTSLTCMTALRMQFYPPFFTPAYFLALVHLGMVAFVALVLTAVIHRREADWHKRLMVGSAVLLMDPALGRVLPMPLIVPWGEWLAMVVQLMVAVIIARHDRRVLGRVHPATTAVMLVIVLNHMLVELLAISPWWIGFARGYTAA
ncbi:hypothetical protein V474_21115 [Novosphingobium barchaimii LL02]|uniref:Uncharacterized protein n=1 Tax=Novosphingobium barchaimii LL02 TaxID=1114963 RepID=A0A0J7XQQ7_9SPHN|nr:hypothetical protein [Novosphingobium barchaimii]KMS54241.1 hypothetical protein V474_21115 [Novosphingobium barchaimii LL02]